MPATRQFVGDEITTPMDGFTQIRFRESNLAVPDPFNMVDSSPASKSTNARNWQQTILHSLASALRKRRLVIVVGAGVTLNATASDDGRILPHLTWKGLIAEGLRWIVEEGFTNESNQRVRKARQLLDEDEEESLLDAADKLKRCLEEHRQFPTWLNSVFGHLKDEIRHPQILEAIKTLHSLGATIVTTNYDDLLETACGLRCIGRSNKEALIKFNSGDLDGIFHIHGSYHDPTSIILNSIDYYVVQHDDLARETMESFFKHQTILFVGTGTGLEDPNFSRLLSWAEARGKNIPNRHVILLRDTDQPSETLNYLLRARCGSDWTGLALYLNELAQAAAAANDINKQDYIAPVSPAAILELLKRSTVKDHIRTWLEAPNTFEQHYDACEKRHKNTGNWFTQNSLFQGWLAGKTSLLWLNGSAGSGKSVLVSTIVQETMGYIALSRKMALAYFYFSYADARKQSSLGLLKALVLQLSSQSNSDALSKLYHEHLAGSPPQFALERTLQTLTHDFERTFIIMDAVDECPAGRPRDSVTKLINVLHQIENLSLLVASRDEPDIRSAIAPSSNQTVSLHNQGALSDIKLFVREKLLDSSFNMWKKHHQEIETALLGRSGGMFRWVDCQMNSIESCLTVNMLREALDSLPESLDETYDRMLAAIDRRYRSYARKILTILCFCNRPVEVCELLDALAIDVETQYGSYDAADKLSSASDLLRICPGMISLQDSEPDQHSFLSSQKSVGSRERDLKRQVVRLSHFSVREYLSSNRVASMYPDYHITKSRSHHWMARLCLAYLIHVGFNWTTEDEAVKSDQIPERRIPVSWYCNTFDFFNYACFEWSKHAAESADQRSLLLLVEKVCSSKSVVIIFAAINAQIDNTFRPRGTPPETDIMIVKTIIELLAYHGLKDMLCAMFSSKETEFLKQQVQYWPSWNAYNEDTPSIGQAESPVDLAIAQSQWETAKLLLIMGFNVEKSPPGPRQRRNSALFEDKLDSLRRATAHSQHEIVELLLKNNLEARNIFKVYFDEITNDPYHPLYLAASNGSLATVQALVTAGIGVYGLKGPETLTPVTRAAQNGRLEVVRYLIKVYAVIYILHFHRRMPWETYFKLRFLPTYENLVHSLTLDRNQQTIFEMLRQNGVKPAPGASAKQSWPTGRERASNRQIENKIDDILGCLRTREETLFYDSARTLRPYLHWRSYSEAIREHLSMDRGDPFEPFFLPWFAVELFKPAEEFATLMQKMTEALEAADRRRLMLVSNGPIYAVRSNPFAPVPDRRRRSEM